MAPTKEDRSMEREKVVHTSDTGHYDEVFIVRNGDTVGTYRRMCAPDGRIYGAGRDFHRIATPDEVRLWEAKSKLADPWDDDVPFEVSSARSVEPCEFHNGKPCICDGSSLVEKTADDDEAFKLAALMAGTDS